MIYKKLKVYIIVVCAVLFFLKVTVFPEILQGRLDEFGPAGVLPASFIYVTLSTEDKRYEKTEQTGTDGIYYFEDCPPGTFILKVWVKGSGEKTLDYKVTVEDKEVTDIVPILIHSLRFKYPRSDEELLAGSIISAKGTHYALPQNACVWIVLKDRSQNYILPTNRQVNIKGNGTWGINRVHIKEGATEIIALLVNRSCASRLRNMTDNNASELFYPLPEGAYNIASRKIDVR